MKKLLLVLMILCPCVCNAGKFDDVPEFNEQRKWSYAAFGKVMQKMRSNCEKTNAGMFTTLSNWMREKDAYFSGSELISKCMSAGPTKVVRSKDHKCAMPSSTCANGNCGEVDFTGNTGCDVLITSLILLNDSERGMLKIVKDVDKPGTYVRPLSDFFKVAVYQVVDVVLAPGYWKNGKIDNNVNNNPENTKIYDITDCKIVRKIPMDIQCKELPYHTWTNDMFLNTHAAVNEKGDVYGVYTNSYIWLNKNLNNEMYNLHYNHYGEDPTVAVISVAYESRQGGAMDIKDNFYEKYKISGQTDIEAHTNGVLFENKIAHLDWLGHFLFGMNAQTYAPGSKAVADAAAQALSKMSSGYSIVPLGPNTWTLVKTNDAVSEAYNMQNAWELGRKWARENGFTKMDKNQKKAKEIANKAEEIQSNMNPVAKAAWTLAHIFGK